MGSICPASDTPDMDLTLRTATPADAAGIVAIYAPIVRDTTISFELEPPDEAEVAARIARTRQTLPWRPLARSRMPVIRKPESTKKAETP